MIDSNTINGTLWNKHHKKSQWQHFWHLDYTTYTLVQRKYKNDQHQFDHQCMANDTTYNCTCIPSRPCNYNPPRVILPIKVPCILVKYNALLLHQTSWALFSTSRHNPLEENNVSEAYGHFHKIVVQRKMSLYCAIERFSNAIGITLLYKFTLSFDKYVSMCLCQGHKNQKTIITILYKNNSYKSILHQIDSQTRYKIRHVFVRMRVAVNFSNSFSISLYRCE